MVMIVGSVPRGAECKHETENDDYSDVGDFSFMVIGDWGTGNENQMRVARALRRLNKQSGYKYKMLLSTGDQFYPHGVSSTEDEQFTSKFNAAFYPGGADEEEHGKAPPIFYPTMGNHDCEGSIASQVEYTKQSEHWKMPSDYYVQDIPLPSASSSSSSSSSSSEDNNGNDVLRLVVLNGCSLVCGPAESPTYDRVTGGNHRCKDIKDTGGDRVTQYEWARTVLFAEKASGDRNIRWKIVMGHWPVFSVMGNGPTYELVRHLGENIMDRAGVDMYFSGHDHSLQHHQPIPLRRSIGTGYVDYFVSGGGGYDLHKALKKSADGARKATPAEKRKGQRGQRFVSDLNIDYVDTKFARGVFGFMTVDIKGDEANVSFYGLDDADADESASASQDAKLIYSTTMISCQMSEERWAKRTAEIEARENAIGTSSSFSEL